MAKETLGKTVKQLKQERTLAKSAFTKQANYLSKAANEMIKDELQEEFSKLSSLARHVSDANEDYRSGLLAEAGTEEDGEVKLNKHQQAELEQTMEECDMRLRDIREAVQANLWPRYGKEDVDFAFQEAEEACDRAQASPVTAINRDGYELLLERARRLIHVATVSLKDWEKWIPHNQTADLKGRLKDLRISGSNLEARRAEFLTAQRIAEDQQPQPAPVPQPVVRIKPTCLPKFIGIRRNFHRWKRDWESLQKQGEPTGSVEVKKFQLLDSVDERICRDLSLTTYNSAEDIFRVLQNRYGNKPVIALEIIEDLERIPPLKSHQPRKVIDLIQAVEKALNDLTELESIGAIKNPLVIRSIESKLPDNLKRDWLAFMVNPRNGVTPDNHFDILLTFLKTQEDILEKLDQLGVSEKPEKKAMYPEKRYASTKSTRKGGCVVCGDEKHRDKIFFCKQFKELKPGEKLNAIERLGACKRCLRCHVESDECTDTYLCRNRDCRRGSSSDHHFFLCLKGGFKGKESVKVGKPSTRRQTFTEEQEELMSELTPDMAEKVRRAFTNMAEKSDGTGRSLRGVMDSSTRELPVILMLLEVTTNTGQKIGTLIDLASDTNYITHVAARRLNLQSEKITLVVHGVGGMAMKVKTKRYVLKVRIKTPRGTERAHELICYGLDEIAKVHRVIKAQQLKKFFPDTNLEDLHRPAHVELLISHREGRLVPQRVKVVGDLVLWEGPLGKTVGGAHPDLCEVVGMALHNSETHFARSMRITAVKYKEIAEMQKSRAETRTTVIGREFLDWWKWDSIGAACEPMCGGCRCGNCQPGGKDMTLSEEKELEVIRRGLSYVKSDAHSQEPHWDTKYPWIEDPSSLLNNRSAVEATFLRTEKQLKKEPEWHTAYTTQVHEMVERRAAKKLSRETIANWKGPVWYVSHLVAPNPHSVTTPVRLVWNSSQKFRGISMNDLLLKGPDVLNPIRAVLLRFRKGAHAALGDIKKMYNSVWLEDLEMHLHRFLWRNSGVEEIEEYCITRVNIGDRPAGCIAQLAMRETARLPMFTHLKEERRVIEEDSYVDDILTSHNDLEKLNETTKKVEEILKAGGFFLKPWVRSGQSGRQTSTSVHPASSDGVFILPNQIREGDNKALGVGYLVEPDKLYLMTSINFSKRKRKMRMSKNLIEEEVRGKTPNPLTRRQLLSQVASLYDPIGLATPAKQKGAILVRKAFQEAGGKTLSRDTWDTPLSERLREEAIHLFEEYTRLNQITFHRSLTPVRRIGEPWGITFSDGSDQSYGAVAYFRWETEQGILVRLVESKAKLTPLDQKGEAVKAEVCGAVFAARLRKYIERHSRMQVERWLHLLDSQTVLGAIQRDSYGYQTFFANRVGEIQKSTSVEDWRWIPGEQNVADLTTRGATPEDLKEDSVWQNGPEFLKRPVEEWPTKSARDVAAEAKEGINKLQRKCFTAALTRAQMKRNQHALPITTMPRSPISNEKNDDLQSSPCGKGGYQIQVRRSPSGSSVRKILDIGRFSSLSKLIRTIAWVWRAATRWKEMLAKTSITSKPNRKEIPSALEIKSRVKETTLTIMECEDALRDLFLAAQMEVTLPDITLSRLAVVREESTGLLLCGGRFQIFNEEKTAVPVLPYTSWVSTLLAQEAHKANHEEIAGTLLRMRKKAWVVRGRKLAQKIVDNCVTCRRLKARRCQQIMSDLPSERITPANPFEYTTMDLFGPYEVKDEVRKKVKLKVWGIVFCCMASRAMHTDLVSDQSAEGFLLAYQRFTALRGHPRKLWSDPGKNFVGARPALKELYMFLNRLEKSKLEDEVSKHGTEWSWKINPADSPHRNGAAEAAVRIIKRALHNLGGDGVFTWGEFQTFLYMASNLANERPIDARTQSREDCVEYISPNSLLLGRTGPRGDPGTFDFKNYPYRRLRIIQTEVDRFWRKWSQLAGPNLFVRTKWHTIHRNVAVGDVVWLADQNALRGQFRLARVIDVNTDRKGIVRDVYLRSFPSYPVATVKPAKKTQEYSTKIPATVLHRDVRRIVVILPAEEQQ
ncbi:uncharacterized protein LOC120459751 [Pimephales promelas]|uniref:uncharacterized protein LOC120459751 n=1 Tax=Pimephales promelas TaxID=90988 RepID=UPI0019559C9D|nr:uncharacterized protein LOC120459751 [Pimephales promelas]